MNWKSDWPVTPSVAVTLTIPLKDAWPATITAKQVGDLAVHKMMDEWRVTHVPTLTSFHKAIPVKRAMFVDGYSESLKIVKYTEAQLLNWCAKVQADKLNDWEALRLLTPDDYKDRFEAKRAVLEHCLGIDVE
jgi:hypothetical protein